MYIEFKASYGPTLFVNIEDIYLEKRETTFYAIGVYNGKEYDITEETYDYIMEKFVEFAGGNDAESES